MASVQRYVVVGVLLLALLVGAVFSRALAWSWELTTFSNPWFFGLHELSLTNVLGYGLGLGAGLLLLSRSASRTWVSEVAVELSRVNWPSREETVYALWVVLIAVCVCAIYLGALDLLWLWLTNAAVRLSS